jgi:hypothetical protein
VPQVEAGTDNKNRPHDAAHQQQTNAGPTVRECGVKSSQHAPDRLLGRGRVARTPLRGGRCDSLGSLATGSAGAPGKYWSYSSMMPRLTAMIAACARSLASSFRKNALDSPFDRVLGDAEVTRNLLVRLPGGDKAQHDQFGRCQRLIADMLSDLERRLRRQTPFASMDRSDGLQQI